MEKRIITIDNESFEYVKTRVYTPVSIYRSSDTFLKIGPKDLIQKELRAHKNLLKFGFPVAEIIKQGSVGENNYYYAEKSLGDNHFGHIFSEDYEKTGAVSEKHFTNLLLVTEKFAEAQIKSATKEYLPQDFYLGVNINYIIDELPYLKKNILEAFEKAVKKLSVFPFVITHGDFNPHNLFTKGVIDFMETFYAPAGYDLIVNIFHIFLFPKNKDYEFVRKYEFFPEQIKHYLSFIDNIYIKNGLLKPSEFVNEFMFCRTIWAAARTDSFPKIQKWRRVLLRKVLKDYLANKNIIIPITLFDDIYG